MKSFSEKHHLHTNITKHAIRTQHLITLIIMMLNGKDSTVTTIILLFNISLLVHAPCDNFSFSRIKSAQYKTQL